MCQSTFHHNLSIMFAKGDYSLATLLILYIEQVEQIYNRL